MNRINWKKNINSRTKKYLSNKINRNKFFKKNFYLLQYLI